MARGRRPTLRAVVAALCLFGVACAHALNYLDPAGPLYETRDAGAPSEAALGRPLRVVTFNIEFALHVDRAIAVLHEAPELRDFDLLALQEMDAPGVERIASALRLNSLYAPGGVHPSSKRDFGCALLSPWPLIEPRKVLLPHGAHATGLRRAAVGATLLRAGKRLRVYSVHLGSFFGVSGGERRHQVDALLADAADSPDPVIIAGDLNSHGIGDWFVKAGYLWLTRDVGATTSEMGVFKLSYDHVLARGLVAALPSPSAGAVRDNQKASDHRPVWALFDVDDASGPAP